MKRQQIILTFLLVLSACVCAIGQISPKESRARGEMYFLYEKYHEALPLLLKAQTYNPKNNDLKYMLGVCYVNVNRPDAAEDYLRFAIADKKPRPESFYYLAKSLHDQQKFGEASKYYKQYLGANAKEKNRDEVLHQLVKENIQRCALADKMRFKEQLAFVEQIADISTKDDEFAPIVSPRQPNTLYYTALRRGNKGGLRNAQGKFDTLAGKPRADIYVVHSARGEWSEPVPLGMRYNSRQNDMLADFSGKGDVALIYRSYTMDKGNMYMGEFSDDEEALPLIKMPKPVTTKNWEGNGYFYKDNVLFFASDREGGYGGKDLYYSMRDDETGRWSPPVNLGADVNSEYDEDTPFLSKDGNTLYFSSNTVDGIGGYDIFKAQFSSSTFSWESPVNLGMPINSPGDDLYFRLDKAGLQAHFSSNRAGGMGGQDIYIAYFNNYQKEQTASARTVAFYEAEVLNKPEKEIAEPEKKTPTITAAEEIRTYQFSPVFYNNNDQKFSPSASMDMNQLATIMTKYPKLMLELTAHTDDSGLAANNLYFSAKRGEVVAKYLTDRGVSGDRILVKGCGSNYPQALNKKPDGTPNAQGRTLNRRVTIRVFNTENTPVMVEAANAAISPAFKANDISTYEQAIKGLSYKVQIKRTRQRFEDPILASYKHTMIESSAASPHLLYTTALEKRFSSAERVRLQLVQSGFEEALVIPYIDGMRASKEEIEQYVETYPDLRYYLEAIGKQANNSNE